MVTSRRSPALLVSTSKALPSRAYSCSAQAHCQVLLQSKLRAQDRLVVGRESGSPRRSLKLQFTCNRCQTRNVATVNPLAWRYGTVFIECGGCKVKHKMVDHLNVAEEVGITAGEMDLTQQERMREMMSDVKLQAPE